MRRKNGRDAIVGALSQSSRSESSCKTETIENETMTTDDAEFLFVSHTMELGGIESLVARMVNSLRDSGFRVTLAAPDGPMLKSIDQNIQHIAINTSSNFWKYILEHYNPKKTTTLVNIWSSLPTMCFELYDLQKALWKSRCIKTRSVTGIFHPGQWKNTPSAPLLSSIIARSIQYSAPTKYIYFMNEPTRAAHVARWGRHLETWPVHRLALSEKYSNWTPPKSTRLLIVSVGRLVGFKAYNFGAINVTETLLSNGIEFQWDIWGDGDQKIMLEEQIETHNFVDYIRLRGELEYAKFDEVVGSYDLFIGMGTAALEAASLGVPTLVTPISRRTEVYGFLFEAPPDSIGEIVGDHDMKSSAEEIIKFSKLDFGTRQMLGEKCRAAVASRAGDEAPPYENLFCSGIPCPSIDFRTLGFRVLCELRKLKRIASYVVINKFN